MASSLGFSYQRGSDIEYDYCCTHCEEGNKNSEALFYCTNYCKLYCDPCVKLHGELFKRHSVLDRKNVDKWQGASTPPVKTDHVYIMVSKQKYNVTMESDQEETCNITGCCKLPNGNTVIVDWNNNKMKLLNRQYRVLSHCDSPSWPRDICHIADSEVAVTTSGWNINAIHFINTYNDKLSFTRNIQLNHSCRGLVHQAGQLYVCSPTALYIYTMAGQLVKKLHEDTSDSRTVYRFAVSDDGRRIYITDESHNTLITLDNSGNKLATLADPDMKNPGGVQVSQDGSVFVCSYESPTVIQVAADGNRKLATLAGQATKSISLCLDRKSSTLIVGQHYNDDILVIKIK